MENQCEKLKRGTPYPLADWYPRCIPVSERRNVKAVWNGEKRKPRKGEWYLSGAIIEAYLAPSDLDCQLPIAELVTVKTETIMTVLGRYPNE